ncbi:fasciclin domain-containing protein [Marinobacter confluentis]|uniref:Fasciclin domain-containing protein n=1 Tax=Marinobacter confluentis TaxID=1697557 RepID=A0A4Z1CIU1_9GAMM|nr:fasciclin domain-containing protein [Marinobacter confluentis]TGN41092.1 fasciclin domain-containing protein [Marinobacter confluentis]
MSFLSSHSKFRRWAPALILVTFPFISACSDDDDDDVAADVAPQNILEIASENENTTILESAVLAADPSIATLLGGDDELTVFAPTDAAFQALLTDLGLSADQLLADTDLLNEVLSYHVLATSVGEVKSDAAIGVAQSPVPQNLVPTVNGEDVALSISQESGEDVLYVNTSRVTGPDVDATNGVIHLIDKVLLPPPSDLSDTSQTIADIVTALAGAEDAEFTTLLAALQTDGAAALLAAASDENATLTVFAPTDEAFATLLEEQNLTPQQLLDDPNLPTVLSQHIVGSTVDSLTAYASNGGTVTNLAGTTLNVDIQDNALVIEGSRVVEADVEASNGVIHVIDEVIFTVD